MATALQYGLARRRKMRGNGPLSGLLNMIGLAKRKRRVHRGRGIVSKVTGTIGNIFDMMGLARRRHKRHRGGKMMNLGTHANSYAPYTTMEYRRPLVGMRRHHKRMRGGFIGLSTLGSFISPLLSQAKSFISPYAQKAAVHAADFLGRNLGARAGRSAQYALHNLAKGVGLQGFARRRHHVGTGRVHRGGAYRTIVW